eukprot:CAMPEP_0195527190 /NCGR_PEP_ID=MMETSP0794_2-20130614/28705_1 /TAXON_ID=515487 /ORGANISM="Stephanopyxis turris, Strain CCMP 815" /LENGTH=129 /DNA_ID=CAMNT_0040658049 /DNA_START=15 /DNA_END=401 /DNA_ORIENTATION=-
MSPQLSQQKHNEYSNGDIHDDPIVGLQRINFEGHKKFKSSPVDNDSETIKLRTARQQRLKWKINVFVFIQILLKYLKKVDITLHLQAKEIIHDCAKMNRTGDPAYQCLATAIQLQLRQTVGETHWTKID